MGERGLSQERVLESRDGYKKDESEEIKLIRIKRRLRRKVRLSNLFTWIMY